MDKEVVEIELTPRPKHRTPVDPGLIFKLAAIHCSNKEIASIVGIHIDSLQRFYNDIIKAGKESGRGKLRRKMWEQAMAGNTTMLIWLSKQHLGFTDAPVATEDRQPLPWSDDEPAKTEAAAEDPNLVTGVKYQECYEDLTELKEELKTC